eukprot:TRINITY_DN42399_c0_g1_i2.p1 TRINITY_DN42399_c0_g1~~TRINITY_DN42399_c0_g1_i2.p1  ORF type:complete len:422 (+),score=89.22 TRINITY_DN42399_c0_g1_i2:449-1714(+)
MRSVWEHPGRALYAQLLELVQRLRQEAPTGAEGSQTRRWEAAKHHLAEIHSQALEELEDWSGPYIADGREYFYNDALQKSSWDNPVDVWEQRLGVSEAVLKRCLLGDSVSSSTSKAAKSFRLAVHGIIMAQRLKKNVVLAQKSYTLQDEALSQDVIRQIDLDMPRTAGSDVELRSCLGTARALLLKYAAEDPQVGYCQGMNMVAALFSIATRSQQEAQDRFRAFTKKLRGLWLPGFPLLQEGMGLFTRLARTRPWFQHLCRNGVGPEMYLPRAWLSVFASWLQLPTRVLLLRQLENEGLSGLLAVSLALLDHAGPSLLDLGDDEDDILIALEGLRRIGPHPAALLAATEDWLKICRGNTAAGQDKAALPPPIRREGSRVLDWHGREAIFGRRQRLSAAWAEKKAIASKALLRLHLRSASEK